MKVTERKRRGLQYKLREDGLGEITKTREVDRDFNRQVDKRQCVYMRETLSSRRY